MRALVLSQVPNPHITPTVTADQLPLIRMNNHIVDRRAMRIIALHAPRTRIPYLDGAVLGARHHPFSFAVERDAGYVGGVAFEGEDGVGVCGFDFVEFDRVVTGGGEEAFVWGDAEPVYLRVRVWNCAGADSGEGLPEANCVVVASWGWLVWHIEDLGGRLSSREGRERRWMDARGSSQHRVKRAAHLYRE